MIKGILVGLVIAVVCVYVAIIAFGMAVMRRW